MSAALDRFARLPRLAVVAFGLLCVLLIASVDYAAGPRVLLSIFYLLPVMLVAWATASTGCGFIIAGATFLVGPVEALLTDFQYISPGLAVWNGAVRLAVFCIVLFLMQKLRVLMGRLQEQALADELTGLANLRALRDAIAREIERSRRFAHPLTLAYVDIDDFKRINDRSGHDAGDRTLICFASVARATARAVDTVARVGGDEFVVLMPETEAAPALLMADRLREAFSRAASLEGTTVTCSIGLASFERAPASVEEMLTTADDLMYAAKADGGDDVRSEAVASRGDAAASGRVITMPSRSNV